MHPAIDVTDLSKNYANGFKALRNINLKITRGEIFALLGPNGAGKTTLIGIICGIVNATAGTVLVDGYNIVKNYRLARSLIGLVPQELTTDAFETVWATTNFSRGLFGKSKNHAYIEYVLKSLSLWDKRNDKIRTLSGGMKRRLMIAKALSHEPQILFLDEPTAGVDVSLRQSMWEQIKTLRDAGVTIILTTHYIEEAEKMADRIGVINNGKLILVDDKSKLMGKLGSKQLILDLIFPILELPSELKDYNLALANQGSRLIYTYDSTNDENGIPDLMKKINVQNIKFKDLSTVQTSLEDIFVKLVTTQ